MNDTGFKILDTEDGTCTLYSSEYSQAMHSDSGAYEEALLKHVYPSKILDLEKRDIYVLDAGFGIGYNSLSAIYELSKKKADFTSSLWKMIKHSSLLSTR